LKAIVDEGIVGCGTVIEDEGYKHITPMKTK